MTVDVAQPKRSDRYYKVSFLRSLQIQTRVLRALIIRNVISEYGRANIGFLWVVVEPMLFAIGVLVMWSLFRGAKGDVSLAGFVLSGYIALTLWRRVTSGSSKFARKLTPLRYHRNVTIFDGFIAKVALVTLGGSAAFVAAYVGLRVLGKLEPLDSLAMTMLGWVMMCWLSAAVGANIGLLTEIFEPLSRFLQIFQYLMLPISGVFFLVEWLPPEHRDVVLYVPTVHCYEMMRYGFFGDVFQPYFSIGYIVSFNIVATATGLWSIHRLRYFVTPG